MCYYIYHVCALAHKMVSIIRIKVRILIGLILSSMHLEFELIH
jgi:hypothetical protein